ncbi:membrane lipoprotein lipid attachment site-containing protein [Halobacillus litoralis]|uniref:membrane lipoprotein lipid attachment site-containing protein n=1 Tax=Halobacillus litoralis TaxID=45668 RepID=UPI001CD5B18B|nr:membrane lipoprotein lipid attachment site-containing protein [Halobacillus litoralis]MCA0971393.1 membrane lipoprotein lipid attachment site-containing protein [Halobacillus litoralis]
MKKYIFIISLTILLAACGSSNQDSGASDPEEKERPYADYPMLVDSCTESSIDAKEYDDLSDEEKEMYELMEPIDAISDDDRKQASMSHAHQEFFENQLNRLGYEEVVKEIEKIGTLYIHKGSLVVQLKKSVPEEQKELKEAVQQAITNTNEHFNNKVVYVQEVQYSTNELWDAQTQLLNNLEERRASLEGYIGGISTCTEGNILSMELRKDFSDEMYQFINDSTEIPIVIEETSLNELTGYVTSVSEDSFFFDMTNFQRDEHNVEVGDSVTVSFGNMKLSLPGSTDAVEIDIHEPKQPEGADLSSKLVVQKTLDKLDDEGYVMVEDMSYDEEADQWSVDVRTVKDLDEGGESVVEVADQ